MYQKPFSWGNQSVNPFLRDTQDEAIFYEIFNKREYECCVPFLQNAKHCVIDCGAHIGAFSLFANLINPNIPIFAYEAHPENFSVLQINTQNLPIQNFCQAVASQNGEQALFLSKKNQNHSLQTPYFSNQQSLQIPVTTLQTVFETNNIQLCDLIKMDIEGAEFEVIQNLPDLVFQKIQTFCLEYHESEQHKKEELIQHFKKYGFFIVLEKQSEFKTGIIVATKS